MTSRRRSGRRWRRFPRRPSARIRARSSTNTPRSSATPTAPHRILDVVKSVCAGIDAMVCEQLERLTLEHLRKFHNGTLLNECRRRCIESNTYDPFWPMRKFLHDLLRQPGEENEFSETGKPSTRVHGLPLMPLLCGDNPINNTLPAKFLRLTDYQLFLLGQWSRGLFYNEDLEGWAKADPWWPYGGWTNKTARDLDRGVLSNLLGGAFCPGGECTWIIRSPAIWREPYRIKADPGYYNFGQTAAQANFNTTTAEVEYATYLTNDLSQTSDFDIGLQPGDLSKYDALPWQADFNECSSQTIDITYEEFNKIYPDSVGDSLMTREQRQWETLWWPARRPMQTFELVSISNGPNIQWLDWTPGVTQTNAGDLKMVTEWWRLPFVRRNPFMQPWVEIPNAVGPQQYYISVERTKR